MSYRKSNFLINSQSNIGTMPRVNEFMERREKKVDIQKSLFLKICTFFWVHPAVWNHTELQSHLLSTPGLKIPYPQNPQPSRYTKWNYFHFVSYIHESGVYISTGEKSSALYRHCDTFHPLKLPAGLSLEFPKLPR